MKFEPHELFFYGLTIVGVIVWLCALAFMARTSQLAKAAADPNLLMDMPPTGNLMFGTAEVAGRPDDLAAKAAAFLAKQGPMALGPLKILEQSTDRVAFESMAGSMMPTGMRSLFRRGELRFRSVASDRTEIIYAVEYPPRGALLVLGWLFVILGLAALIAGFLLIQNMVIDHPNPEVRWQSVQMVQTVHFLWPPFLFGGIYRRLRSHVRATMDGLVNNLPYFGN
jgi:hypothetical protein